FIAMGGGRSDDKGTKKEEEKENLYRKREFSHPRKLAKMAGLDPPREKMFVAEHDGKFPHTDRVINSFCSGLTAFGLISVFS
ncbi:hypothetical protein PMAYCL1PPCAC_12638, partial [Pristionchus mayeri]